MSGRIETRLLAEPWDVDRRLKELDLTLEGLLVVVRIAMVERNSVTGLHALNAAGTLAYHHGLAQLRREFLGEIWVIDHTEGIETIRHVGTGVRIGFCGVEEACGLFHPKPRSAKGPGAERACGPMLFDDLPTFVRLPAGAPALYYVMVDPFGAAELTRPVIERGTFTGAVERIVLTRGGDEEAPVRSSGAEDTADGFDPVVVRKQA